MATREQAQSILEQLAGPGATLRDDQWVAIEALVVHRRQALVVQRTGWGKSAVYFIAAKLLRATGHGPTVIVSPLLALMRNQVEAAERAGCARRRSTPATSPNGRRSTSGSPTVPSMSCWSARNG